MKNILKTSLFLEVLIFLYSIIKIFLVLKIILGLLAVIAKIFDKEFFSFMPLNKTPWIIFGYEILTISAFIILLSLGKLSTSLKYLKSLLFSRSRRDHKILFGVGIFTSITLFLAYKLGDNVSSELWLVPIFLFWVWQAGLRVGVEYLEKIKTTRKNLILWYWKKIRWGD